MLTAYPSDNSSFGITCSAGAGYVGMYLDGAPVPQSAAMMPTSASPRALTLFGLTGVVQQAPTHSRWATTAPTGPSTPSTTPPRMSPRS